MALELEKNINSVMNILKRDVKFMNILQLEESVLLDSDTPEIREQKYLEINKKITTSRQFSNEVKYPLLLSVTISNAEKTNTTFFKNQNISFTFIYQVGLATLANQLLDRLLELICSKQINGNNFEYSGSSEPISIGNEQEYYSAKFSYIADLIY